MSQLRDVTHSESIPRSLNVSEKVMALRTAAAAVYDRAKMQGKSDEDAGRDVNPIRTALDEVMRDAIENDVAGAIMAIHRMDAMAKAHEEDIKFLMQKAYDTQYHADQMRRALMVRMKREGLTELHDRDFSALLTVEGDEEKLTLR